MPDRVILYAGGDAGYGDAISVGRNSYPWTWGMDNRVPGRATLSIIPSTVAGTDALLGGPVNDATEWEDSDGVPLMLLSSGYSNVAPLIHRLKDSVFFGGAHAGVAGDNPFTSGVLYRHDGSDADAEMAYFCNGSDQSVLTQRNKAGAYSTAGHEAKADLLAVIGGDLWRSEGYKVSSLIRDFDPGLEASWNAAIKVGRPTWKINAILELGGSPLVIKPEGMFRYNPAPSVARFENLTPFIPPHPDNGKAAFGDGRGRIYYDTVDGDILVLTFGAQSQQRPIRTNWIDRDTPWGRIGAMAADTEHVYAAVVPGQVRTQQLGMVLQVFDNGILTTATTEVTDQKLSTTADLSLLTNVAADLIQIGADEPFWGIYAELEGAGNPRESSTVSFTAEYSSGPSGSNFTSVTIKDSTGGFTQSGCVAILPTSDIFQDTSNAWQKNTQQGVTKYWLRLRFSGDMTATKISQMYLCPYRPPIDKDLFPNTGQMLAGVLPKILVGSWRGESIVWHDVWTLPSAEIHKLIVSRTRGANSTGGRTLWAISTDAIYYMPIGADAHPVRAPWPLTNGTTEPHIQAFSGNHMGLPTNVKTVQKLVISGEYLQADDELWVYHRWDNDDRWHPNGAYTPFPVVVENLEGSGRVLHVVVQIKDATRDAIAPFITWAEIPENAWTDEGPEFEAIGTDIASPQDL